VGNYVKLLQERSLGEMRMTEWSSVTYDNLGHSTLCLLHRFPKWKAYLLEQRRPLIEKIASLNSSAAKEMLAVNRQENYGSITNAELANRFFLGDIATLEALRAGYNGNL
jgi:hypothetical protein